MRSLFFSVLLLVSLPAAAQDSFLFYDLKKNEVVHAEGDTQTRMSPCSTFKIPLALMGFETGFLKDADTPKVEFKPEYLDGYHIALETWKQDQTPRSWLRHSCVWFSQVLTQKMGLERFKEMVGLLNYGNQDISGDNGKDNRLTQCWLSSSLKISPQEQLQFLQNLYNQSYPLSSDTFAKTKEIMFVDQLNGWTVRGKTGSGYQEDEHGLPNFKRKHGWLVCWLGGKG